MKPARLGLLALILLATVLASCGATKAPLALPTGLSFDGKGQLWSAGHLCRGMLAVVPQAGWGQAPPLQKWRTPLPADDTAGQAAAERLSGAVCFPTISYADIWQCDAQAFFGLHDYPAQSYPRTHAEKGYLSLQLTVETAGGAWRSIAA